MLNDFLYHRKKAISLRNQGLYWLGLDEVRVMLTSVPFSDVNYVKADAIIEKIDNIESDSHKETGILYCNTGWMQQEYRNKVARKHFNGIMRGVTRLLQSEGYFEMLNLSTSPFFDPSDNKKSGERFKR